MCCDSSSLHEHERSVKQKTTTATTTLCGSTQSAEHHTPCTGKIIMDPETKPRYFGARTPQEVLRDLFAGFLWREGCFCRCADDGAAALSRAVAAVMRSCALWCESAKVRSVSRGSDRVSSLVPAMRICISACSGIVADASPSPRQRSRIRPQDHNSP